MIRLDRSQRSFKLSFDAFYRRRVGSQLIASSRTKLRQQAALLDRIERRFGVPREILVSIWGLETNFGRDRTGNLWFYGGRLGGTFATRVQIGSGW